MKLHVVALLLLALVAGCAADSSSGAGGPSGSTDVTLDGGGLGTAGNGNGDGAVDGVGLGNGGNADGGGDNSSGAGTSGNNHGNAGTGDEAGSGGTAGSSGSTAGSGGGTAGTSGGTAGTSGGTAGTSGGTAGTSGGTAGTSGGTAGTSGGTAGSSGGTAGSSGGTAGTSGGTPTRQEFCAGAGPVVKVPTSQGSSTTTCTGTIASELFTNAICTCEDTSFAGYMVTRSFNSAQQSPVVAQGAPIGVNGQLLAGSYVDAGGTTRVQGATAFGGYLNVAGDLQLKQDVTLLGYLTVDRDVWFENDATITAGAIGRNLHTQTGNIEPPLWVGVGGTRTQSNFDLEPPCKCEPEDILDIDAIVDDGQLNNDNDDPSVLLDPASLTDLIGYTEKTLPCGRYYVDEITGIGDLKLKVDGRTVLYVGGDVGVTGFLDVELGPNGQLDMFVRGNMVQIGYGKFGDQNRPSNVRVYVGGESDILYLGYQPFGGNLYAPKARLWSAGYIDVRGSVFVRELDAGAYINVEYDRDILDQGDDDECQPPPPPDDEPPPECTDVCMSGCGTGNTCVGGMCGKCMGDADCCAPLVCDTEAGTCGPLLY